MNKLIHESTSQIEAFKTSVNEVSVLMAPLLEALKKFNIEVNGIDDIIRFLESPEFFVLNLPGDIKEEAEPVFRQAIRGLGWKRKWLNPEFMSVKNYELVISEPELEAYIDSHFRVYDVGQVQSGKEAIIQFIEALNKANRFFNFRELDLPLFIGFNKDKGGFYFREHLLKNHTIKTDYGIH